MFLTPYIVHTPDDLESSTADEVSRTQLMHKAFTERELAEFLQATNFDTKTGTQTSSSKSVTTTNAQSSQPEVRRATAVIPAAATSKKSAAR